MFRQNDVAGRHFLSSVDFYWHILPTGGQSRQCNVWNQLFQVVVFARLPETADVHSQRFGISALFYQ
jgi:hypothetical protein